MSTKFITTASDIKHPGWLQLKRSLDHFGWPSVCIHHEWRGFGGKILETYKYLTETEEGRHIDFFFYSDSYDSFCLGPMHEALEKVGKQVPFFRVTFSTEKACYPHSEYANEFPNPGHQWRYLNGGGWYCMRSAFLKMVERSVPDVTVNDQAWFQQQYINNNERKQISLEAKPDVFQTIGFEHPDDFAYRQGRLINLETLTKPIFIHGNGKTPLSHIYKLIP